MKKIFPVIQLSNFNRRINAQGAHFEFRIRYGDAYSRGKVYFIHVHWKNGPITPVYRSYSTLLELQERLLTIEDFLLRQNDEANTGTLLKRESFSNRFTIKKRAKALRRMPVVDEFLKSIVHRPPHISGSDPVINFFLPLPEDLIESDSDQAHRESRHPESLKETYITMATYEPQLEDEVGFEMGKIIKVIQKNLDGWWFVKLEEKEGWTPAMFLREIASSQHNAREKGKHAAVRAMLRDTRLNSISVIAGRRQTWDPSARKMSVKRNISRHGANQGEPSSTARENSFNTKPARSYVNLEFHEITKRPAGRQTPRQKLDPNEARENSFNTKPARSYVNLEFHEITKRPAGRRTPRQKLDPNEVRAGCRFGKVSNSIKENEKNENGGLLGVGLGFQPRALSFVEEESQETVSRGTSPMQSPLLSRDSSSSKSPDDAFDKPDGVQPSESLDEEVSKNVSGLPIEDAETTHTPDFEDVVDNSHTNEGLEMEDEENSEDKDQNNNEGDDEDKDEGKEYTENMPELVSNKRFYATGSYKKEEDKEVNLRENVEVELLEESEGGWWLVRTSSHSVGWAPSNFLEKAQSLKGGFGHSSGKDLQYENILEVIPIRPPKSPRVLKMAEDMCLENKFWCYIQKSKDMDTSPLDEKDVKPERTSDFNIKNNQLHSEEKENNEVMTSTFDDYECDLENGVCTRKSPKLAGVKYVPRNNAPADKGFLQAEYDGPGLTERSESVPSLAESEDFDDLPSD
ncbi:SH3 and PX domain-containing protein 2A-like [Orbicella faveolata]|uniref:SH3 and PX domain-containing protein 2A-like n=1 Tax=Orbicella faveolata TaxID=48498 RepID=UPI0009E1ABB5|nr:SH3 and PX domain-containing protein 2A-like [Orbicella faveolata]